jgi:hypothetical protein
MLLPGTPADTYLLASSLRSWPFSKTMDAVIILALTLGIVAGIIYLIDYYGKHWR